jgi:hypothetical protein
MQISGSREREGNDSEHEDEPQRHRNKTELRKSVIHPDQTPDVRVLLYCFKPPQPRAAASPPPRQAVGPSARGRQKAIAVPSATCIRLS